MEIKINQKEETMVPFFNNAPSSNLPKPTRLTPQQMDERREKGLCFNCDSKYSKGHKCGEKKLFYIDSEEDEENNKKC